MCFVPKYRTVKCAAVVPGWVIVLPGSIIWVVVGAYEGSTAVLVDEEL